MMITNATKIRPCRHDPMQPTTCPTCRRIATDDRFADLRGPIAQTAPRRKTVSLPTLPCAHRGLATGETRPCKTCTETVQVPLYSCRIHHDCTLDKLVTSADSGAPVQSCRICNEREAPNGIVIDHGAGGLGDALQGMCVVAKLREDNPGKHITYNAGQKAHRDPMAFVRLFDGVADQFGDNAKIHSEDHVPGARQMNRGYAGEDLHVGRGKRSTLWSLPRWERYARNIGVRGFRIPELREPDRIRAAGADCKSRIALCLNSTDPSRSWSMHHALTLENLLIASGYETVVVHHEAKPIAYFRGMKLVSATPERLTGALLNCAAVVATDNGLAHLAGVLKKSLIVLGGWFPVRQIYGCYPGFVGLQGTLECDSCCNGGAIDPTSPTCRPACANLNSILPQRVLDAVDEITLNAVAAGRSLVDWRRLRVLRDAARETNNLALAGDVLQLGVYKGGSAKVLLRYSTAKRFDFCDTFTGLPEDDADGAHKRGEFGDTSAATVQAFLNDRRAHLSVGRFPEVVPDETRYRLAYFDGDLYQSLVSFLDYVIPRMVPGGVMVFDDYGWWKTPGVARGLHERFPAEKILKTPDSYQAVVRF